LQLKFPIFAPFGFWSCWEMQIFPFQSSTNKDLQPFFNSTLGFFGQSSTISMHWNGVCR
jgi:hypothetical protein